MKRILISGLLTAGLSATAFAYNGAQEFSIQSDQDKSVIQLSEMINTFKVQSFTVYNDAYHQDKTYEGIPLKALLEHHNYSLDNISEIM